MENKQINSNDNEQVKAINGSEQHSNIVNSSAVSIDSDVKVAGGAVLQKIAFNAHDDHRSDIISQANETLGSFLAAVNNERQHRALQKLKSRAAYTISKSIVLKGISTVSNAGFTRSTLTPFDIPTLTDQSLFEQLKYASRLLCKNHAEEQFNEIVQLDGRLPAVSLFSRYLYSQLSMTGRIPIGDLSQLSTNHKERIHSYLKLITDRIFSMSTLPLEALPGVVAAFVPEGKNLDGTPLEGVGDIIDNGNFVTGFVEHLSKMETRARERYITQSLLQPLYRNILVNQTDFSWPSIDYIIKAASTMCRWNDLYSNKILHATLIDEITAEWRNDTTVGGFWPLRTATAQGVECNGLYSLSVLAENVVPGDDVPIYSFVHDPNSDVITLSTPFASVTRQSVVRNIFGDTVGIQDTFDSTLLRDDHAFGTIADLQRLIAIYAKLMRVKTTDKVDMSFISKYPEWAGLVFTDEGRSVNNMTLEELIPERMLSLYYFRCMLAIMNGEYVSSDIVNVFSEPNQADLTKGLVDSIEIYALIHQTLMNLVVEQLGIYRSSLEWADSAIWELLDSLGMVVPSYTDNHTATNYERILSSTQPVIFSEDKAIRATRYYVDRQALTMSPILSNLCRTLDNLGVAGECKTVPHHKVMFSSNVDTAVDVSNYISSPDLDTSIKSDMVSSLEMMKVDGIYDLVRQVRRDCDVHIYSQKQDESGRLISGFALVAKFKPSISVTFDNLSYYEQLPLKFIDVDKSLTITSEDIVTLPDELRLQIVPIDPTPFVVIKHDVAPINANVPTMFALKKVDDVLDYVRKWSHKIGASFTSEDFPNGFYQGGESKDEE